MQFMDTAFAYGLYCLCTVYSRLLPNTAKVVSRNSPAPNRPAPCLAAPQAPVPSASVGKRGSARWRCWPVSGSLVWKLGQLQAGLRSSPYPLSPLPSPPPLSSSFPRGFFLFPQATP